MNAGCGQSARIGERPLAQLDLRPRREHRPDDARDVALGEQIGDQEALGRVVDDQPVAELVREPDRGRDVVGAVGVLAPRQLAVQHAHEHLAGGVAVERITLLEPHDRGGRGSPAPSSAHRGSPQRRPAAWTAAASSRRTPASGSRRARSSRCRRLEHHLVDDAAPGLDRDGLAADRVPAARLDDHGRDAAGQARPSKPTSAGLIASSARMRAPFGSVISFVSLPAQPAPSSSMPTCACASMKPGSTQLAAGVDDLDAVRDGDVRTDRGDRCRRRRGPCRSRSGRRPSGRPGRR